MDQTITIQKRTAAQAADGTPNASWAASATPLVLRCMIDPQAGGDSLAFSGENTVIALRIIADPVPVTGSLADLDSHAKATVGGVEYRVSGVPVNAAQASCTLEFTIERDA